MIIINIDVMLAKRKMSVTELSNRVGITMANMSILKNGKAKAINPAEAWLMRIVYTLKYSKQAEK